MLTSNVTANIWYADDNSNTERDMYTTNNNVITALATNLPSVTFSTLSKDSRAEELSFIAHSKKHKHTASAAKPTHNTSQLSCPVSCASNPGRLKNLPPAMTSISMRDNCPIVTLSLSTVNPSLYD